MGKWISIEFPLVHARLTRAHSGIYCMPRDPARHSSRTCTVQSAPLYDQKETPQKTQQPAVLQGDDSGNCAPRNEMAPGPSREADEPRLFRLASFLHCSMQILMAIMRLEHRNFPSKVPMSLSYVMRMPE